MVSALISGAQRDSARREIVRVSGGLVGRACHVRGVPDFQGEHAVCPRFMRF